MASPSVDLSLFHSQTGWDAVLDPSTQAWYIEKSGEESAWFDASKLNDFTIDQLIAFDKAHLLPENVRAEVAKQLESQCSPDDLEALRSGQNGSGERGFGTFVLGGLVGKTTGHGFIKSGIVAILAKKVIGKLTK